MSDAIVRTIQSQSKVLLENIKVTLEFCNDEIMQKTKSNWPIWKQFYHMLHSLDEWFINPIEFIEPGIHQPHFRTSDSGPGVLSKEQLHSYYSGIRSRIENYLSNVSIALLEEKIGKGNLTRLDLILIQFRHVMNHIGYLHCSIRSETGDSPQYIGFKPE